MSSVARVACRPLNPHAGPIVPAQQFCTYRPVLRDCGRDTGPRSPCLWCAGDECGCGAAGWCSVMPWGTTSVLVTAAACPLLAPQLRVSRDRDAAVLHHDFLWTLGSNFVSCLGGTGRSPLSPGAPAVGGGLRRDRGWALLPAHEEDGIPASGGVGSPRVSPTPLKAFTSRTEGVRVAGRAASTGLDPPTGKHLLAW